MFPISLCDKERVLTVKTNESLRISVNSHQCPVNCPVAMATDVVISSVLFVSERRGKCIQPSAIG